MIHPEMICRKAKKLEKLIDMEIPPPDSMTEGRRDCRSI